MIITIIVYLLIGTFIFGINLIQEETSPTVVILWPKMLFYKKNVLSAIAMAIATYLFLEAVSLYSTEKILWSWYVSVAIATIIGVLYAPKKIKSFGALFTFFMMFLMFVASCKRQIPPYHVKTCEHLTEGEGEKDIVSLFTMTDSTVTLTHPNENTKLHMSGSWVLPTQFEEENHEFTIIVPNDIVICVIDYGNFAVIKFY